MVGGIDPSRGGRCTVSPDRGSWSNSATSSAIRSQKSAACASEMRACRMKPHSFPSRWAWDDSRAATSKSLKSRGSSSSSESARRRRRTSVRCGRRSAPRSPAPAGPHHLHQSGPVEHPDVVGDGALVPLERDGQLAHRRRTLVEQAQDRGAEGMADRLHLGGLGERDPVGEVVVRGRRVASHAEASAAFADRET